MATDYGQFVIWLINCKIDVWKNDDGNIAMWKNDDSKTVGWPRDELAVLSFIYYMSRSSVLTYDHNL